MSSLALMQELPVGTTQLIWLAGIGAVLLVFVFFFVFLVKQYKRCPSNRILVIYGKVGSNQAALCLHGGGKFVLPLIQDYAFLTLEPMVIEIPLEGALSLNNIRVNVPATFTVGISTDPVMMNNAAERLLHLDERKVRDQAQDIILGQLRLVIATLSIEEINKDREKFMSLINTNVAEEINKIGLTLINVNIRDITDESGYIEAIGKRAAAEAINRARVEVAEQDRDGATGEAMANRAQSINVANEESAAATGRKDAEQKQRVSVAALEADAIQGEVEATRDLEIATAERHAETVAAKKRAEQEQRVQVASAEARAVQGENESRAEVAESNAKLAEVQAEADRRARVAAAQSQEAILVAEREQELARLKKEEASGAGAAGSGRERGGARGARRKRVSSRGGGVERQARRGAGRGRSPRASGRGAIAGSDSRCRTGAGVGAPQERRAGRTGDREAADRDRRGGECGARKARGPR